MVNTIVLECGRAQRFVSNTSNAFDRADARTAAVASRVFCWVCETWSTPKTVAQRMHKHLVSVRVCIAYLA